MSCPLWFEMTLITPILYFDYFLPWMTCFSFIVIDTCEKKKVIYCGIREMWLNGAIANYHFLFKHLNNYHFCLSNTENKYYSSVVTKKSNK